MTTSMNDRFTALGARFLAEYLELSPVHATALGEHAHDGRWPDVSARGDERWVALIDRTRRELDEIAPASLDRDRRMDHEILSEQLDAMDFTLHSLRPAKRDPMTFTGLVGDGLDPLLTRTFAPLDHRLRSASRRLASVASVLAEAKVRLDTPPRIHTETALAQCDGLIDLCDRQLAIHASDASPEVARELADAGRSAAEALRAFRRFLEDELLPRSDGDPRLGRALFEQRLGFELGARVHCDEVEKSARRLLEDTLAEMVPTAEALWPDLVGGPLPPRAAGSERAAFLRRVIARVADDHPSNETIVEEARVALRDATAFVRERGLVEVPEEPCDVIEMPEYRRGVAIAYCDSPGPFEQNAQTVFAIAPTPAEWSAERARSFYREYNRALLLDLTVHEAMPGHYLQLVHARRFPSDVRAMFSSGPFVEGWAVYTEWLMAHHGFGGAKTRLMRQKMVLRLAANAILDHGVHTGTLTEADAMRLMMEDAFQEEGEAAGKWRRALLTSAQLTTYFHGFREVMRARREAERSSSFDERAFHDRLLAFGSPPVRYLPELLASPTTPRSSPHSPA